MTTPPSARTVTLPSCSAAGLHLLGSNATAASPTAYAQLFGEDWRSVVDAGTAEAFGEPFSRSGWLRSLLAGQGLVPGYPTVWPANVSFEQILYEAGDRPAPRAGASGFAVNIGAGDGKRSDICEHARCHVHAPV